jgi:hypothetical protein
VVRAYQWNRYNDNHEIDEEVRETNCEDYFCCLQAFRPYVVGCAPISPELGRTLEQFCEEKYNGP